MDGRDEPGHDGWGCKAASCIDYGNAVYSVSMHTVVETPSYLGDAERLFSREERAAIVDQMAADPECGVVIPGTGGVRKIRVGFGGRGKRGGARVIYLFGGDDVPVFLLAAFAKNEKADLTAAERNALGKSVAAMLENYRTRT